ncbi:MAG TPA: hypothetical protein VN192_06155 [Flavobacterium sp.]|jgi:ABC-type enterobactin transport system permease subunit|nr:hypothetical protein [Flavobacterium sp.]
MTNIQILILFLIGAFLTLIGVFLKIKELPLASLVLIVGMTFEAAAGVFVIIKLFKKNKNDSFLDS